MDFRTLRAEEIEIRVSTIKHDGSGASFLLYKDARCDMNILDESGCIWQRDHKQIKGNVYCGIGIWNEEIKQFIWKWDAGSESYTEKVKGEASDSFKRACFNTGIGRELYTSPFIWIKLNKNEFYKEKDKVKLNPKLRLRVKLIEFENKKITRLIIVDNNNEVRFEFNKTKENSDKINHERVIKTALDSVNIGNYFMGCLDYFKKKMIIQKGNKITMWEYIKNTKKYELAVIDYLKSEISRIDNDFLNALHKDSELKDYADALKSLN